MRIIGWVFRCILLVVALICGAGFFYTRSQIHQANINFPLKGQTIEVEGQKIAYRVEGAGRDLVLIHGAHGSMYDYDLSLLNDLRKNFRVLLFDRPGFGYSQRHAFKTLTLHDQARILKKVVEQVGMENPILMGHSFGGALALEYATVYPERVDGIVLVSPYIMPYEGPVNPIHYIPVIPVLGPFYMETLFNPLTKKYYIEKALAKVFDPEPVDPRYAEVIKFFSLRPHTYRANAQDIRNFGPALQELHEQLPEIEVPVTVLHGDQDRIAPYNMHMNYLSERIPHRKLIRLEGAGHHPIFTRPKEILKAANEFKD